MYITYVYTCIYIYILHIIREGCYCKGGRGPAAAARPTHSRCRCSKQAPGRYFETLFRRCFPTTTEHANTHYTASRNSSPASSNSCTNSNSPSSRAQASCQRTAVRHSGEWIRRKVTFANFPGWQPLIWRRGSGGLSFPSGKTFSDLIVNMV